MNNNNKYIFKLVNDDEGFLKAKKLFLEYADAIQVDLCFQNFENELEQINIQYSNPSGGLFIIIDNETGILVSQNNIKKIVEAVLKLLDNPSLSKKLGNSGKERAKQESY